MGRELEGGGGESDAEKNHCRGDPTTYIFGLPYVLLDDNTRSVGRLLNHCKSFSPRSVLTYRDVEVVVKKSGEGQKEECFKKPNYYQA